MMMHTVARGGDCVCAPIVRPAIEEFRQQPVGADRVDGLRHGAQDGDEVSLDFDSSLGKAVAEAHDRLERHFP